MNQCLGAYHRQHVHPPIYIYSEREREKERERGGGGGGGGQQVAACTVLGFTAFPHLGLILSEPALQPPLPSGKEPTLSPKLLSLVNPALHPKPCKPYAAINRPTQQLLAALGSLEASVGRLATDGSTRAWTTIGFRGFRGLNCFGCLGV